MDKHLNATTSAGCDRAMSLVEVMIAMSLLAVLTTSVVGTMGTLDARNRRNQRTAIAYKAAQQVLSSLEASSAIMSSGDLKLQNGSTFEIDHASFSTKTCDGHITVTDLSKAWGTSPGTAFEIRIAVDLNGDGQFDDGLDVYGIRVFM